MKRRIPALIALSLLLSICQAQAQYGFGSYGSGYGQGMARRAANQAVGSMRRGLRNLGNRKSKPPKQKAPKKNKNVDSQEGSGMQSDQMQSQTQHTNQYAPGEQAQNRLPGESGQYGQYQGQYQNQQQNRLPGEDRLPEGYPEWPPKDEPPRSQMPGPSGF